MTWLDRLKQSIVLTSPDGNVFTALWQNNPREMEKKLGISVFPKARGAIIQDLDVSAILYPLTIFFQGPDNDLESDRFFQSCKERGTWNIVHPVRGELTLNLVGVVENIAPVESGNITQINTRWIEPTELTILTSSAQLKSDTLSQIDELNSVSADQLSSNVLTETQVQQVTFEQAVNDVVAAADTFLKPIYEFNSTVNARMGSIKRGIDAALSVPLDILSIAGQIQELIQLPLLAIEDVKARISAYNNFLDAIFNLSPESDNIENINTVSVQEIALTSGLAAMSDISVTGTLFSRLEVIELIDTNINAFTNITDNLDLTQELFENQPIDLQYFSQSQSFNNAVLMSAQTLAYLLRTIFDLAVEKRFVLEKPRVPIEITITEYGTLGNNDSNFDLFIDSNFLKGNEIFLLPAGREVVVYI